MNAPSLGRLVRFDDVQRAVLGREVEVLRSLGIDLKGRQHICCPYPNHDDRHPSWRWDARRSRAFCSCSSRGEDVFGVVGLVEGLAFPAAVHRVAEFLGLRGDAAAPLPRPRKVVEEAPEPTGINDYGRRLWDQTLPIEPTSVAAKYLLSRGCSLPPPDGDLRWLPAHRHPAGEAWPVLVGLVTHAVTNAPLTLHRTWIARDGDGKASVEKQRLLLRNCPKRHGVIRLWPDDDVILGLGIAEGVESALAAARVYRPMWACIDAGNVTNFPVLPGIESLTIFADHDPAGTDAATACAARWAAAGKESRIWQAPAFRQDAADIFGVSPT